MLARIQSYASPLLLVFVIAQLVTGCGATDTAINDWTITNDPDQSPDTTVSLITRSENVIFAGFQSPDVERKTLLTAFDLEGDTLWDIPAQNDRGYQAITEHNDFIYVAGGTATATDYSQEFSAPFLEKYDQLGNLIWSTLIGDSEYTGVLIDSDAAGNIYALSYNRAPRETSTTYDMHFSLYQFNDEGVLLSQTSFSREFQWQDPLLAVDSLGNSYIALMSSSPMLFKYTPQGEQEWNREIPRGDGPIPTFRSFAVDRFDRAILFTPVYTEVIPDFIPPVNSLAIAFESNGEIAWQHKIPDPATDYKLDVEPQGMTFDDEGNVYLTHRSDRQDFSIPCWFCEIRSYRLYVTKLDADGEEVWQTVTRTDGDRGENVSVNQDYVLVSDDNTFRTFNTSDGALVIQQEVEVYPREVSQAYMAPDNSMYFVTNADRGRPNYYSLEKWSPIGNEK